MRIEVAGARLPEEGTAIVEEAARLGEEMGVTVQLTDARLVCGKEHLEVAAEKALRAQERGLMTARALAAEVLLYASGERQIQKAIGKMGVRDDTTEVGVVAVGDVDAKDILEALGLSGMTRFWRCPLRSSPPTASRRRSWRRSTPAEPRIWSSRGWPWST